MKAQIKPFREKRPTPVPKRMERPRSSRTPPEPAPKPPNPD